MKILVSVSNARGGARENWVLAPLQRFLGGDDVIKITSIRVRLSGLSHHPTGLSFAPAHHASYS